MIGIEETLRETIIQGRPEFLGIVDLVFASGGTLVIRDYKTSRSKWNQGTAELSADQMLLYSELVKSLLPDIEVKLEFAVITKTKSPTVELFQIDADENLIERTKQVASCTLEAIESGVFYPNQSAMNCGGCLIGRHVGLGVADFITTKGGDFEATKKAKHDLPGPGGFLGRLGWARFQVDCDVHHLPGRHCCWLVPRRIGQNTTGETASLRRLNREGCRLGLRPGATSFFYPSENFERQTNLRFPAPTQYVIGFGRATKERFGSCRLAKNDAQSR